MIEEEKGEAWDEKISVWKLFCLGENKKKSKQRRSTRFTFFFLSLSLFVVDHIIEHPHPHEWQQSSLLLGKHDAADDVYFLESLQDSHEVKLLVHCHHRFVVECFLEMIVRFSETSAHAH